MKEHADLPDVTRLDKKEYTRDVRTTAAHSTANPRNIWNKFEASKQARGTEAVVNAASYKAVSQTIYRERQKHLPDYPVAPKSVSEISLPGWLAETLVAKQSFVFHDSGADDPRRLIMFGTSSFIELLSDADLFCDGTFSCTPLPFSQVYSIQALVEGKSMPIVYALLTNKDKSLYTRVLEVLKGVLKSPPKSITSDFEQAFIQACRDVFPKASLHGCYFHFKQSMWRHVQHCGLAGEYVKKDDRIRNLLKMPQVLAFVPEGEVKDRFFELKDHLHLNHKDQPCYAELTRWYEYFEHNYIGHNVTTTKGRGARAVTETTWVTAPFPIPLWNVHLRILQDMPRTYNSVETWHNTLA